MPFWKRPFRKGKKPFFSRTPKFAPNEVVERLLEVEKLIEEKEDKVKTNDLFGEIEGKENEVKTRNLFRQVTVWELIRSEIHAFKIKKGIRLGVQHKKRLAIYKKVGGEYIRS